MSLLDLNIEELGSIKIDRVYGASKFSEKVTDAPSSVTIITREEITRFGHRTLSDVVRAVRGFDVTYDRNYGYAGLRGFNNPDDYGARTLLLIDGHRMNDPIYDVAAVGTDALLDVDLIERVEFIRGPGSALYGSNAFLGTINVITRSGASINGVEASASGGSFDTYNGRFSLGKKLANGIEYLFSGSTYASAGNPRLFYPEYNTPETNRGLALDLDGDRYWSMFGKVSYGDFTLQGGYVTRDKDVPTASFGSAFNVPLTTVDSRGYLELRYAHETANGWSLTGRGGYDIYDSHGLYPYEGETAIFVNDDSARARWFTAEIGASRTFFDSFRFSLGAEARQSAELRMRNYDGRPFTSYVDVTSDQTVLGAYMDGAWEITKWLTVSGGVSGSHYNSFGGTVNPRAALIWKPRAGSTLKLLYGEAFRAPNIYQLDYSLPGQLANPALGPETIRTYEVVADQYVGQHWHGSLSLFRNEISSLIKSVDDGAGSSIFRNTGEARSQGAEVEIEGKWDNGLIVRGSYTRQEAVNVETGGLLVNSPENLLKAHLSVPVLPGKIFASVEVLYASDRLTLAGGSTGDALLVNATLFSRELVRGLEFSASIYNLLDRKYRTIGGGEHLQDSIEQDGRTFRLKLTYRF